jgi:hypothetical protein
VVGALLMSMAAIGVFVAYTGATRGPTSAHVVAATDLAPGHRITEADLDVVTVDLPTDQGERAFDDPERLAGRVVLGPIGEGEIVQAGAVTAQSGQQQGHEIALLLPRGHVAAHRLQPGDRVDLFSTTPEQTSPIVRDALLLSAGGDSGGAIGEEREVSVVVGVPTLDDVSLVVHALRTADLTVVRSTFAGEPSPVDLPAALERATREAASGAPAEEGS